MSQVLESLDDREEAVTAGPEGDAPGEEAFDTSPAWLSSRLAVLAGLSTALLAGVLEPAAGSVAVLGFVLVAVAMVRASVRAMLVGSFALFLGVAVAGIANPSPEPLLGAAVAAVLAMDLGQQAITLGEQVGHEADTTRGELVHLGTSLAVGVVAAGILLGVFRSFSGRLNGAVLAVLLIAALVLASGLRS